ncbi:MAG: hypothetical protein A2Y57_03250, partial [Candidatus Woykebacteria bacterium RBG_13_40_7b]
MYIGIDIGGTHIRVGASVDGKNLYEKLDFPTKEFEDSFKEIINAVKTFDSPARNATPARSDAASSGEHSVAGGKVKSVGVSVPGPLSAKTNLVLSSPNLKGFNEKPLAEMLKENLQVPVKVEHDASAAALAEATLGAGKGKNPVLYITVSTGIGSGLIVDGKIYRGLYNPEAGHQIIDTHGPKCRCGQGGDLEAFSSGESIKTKVGRHPKEVEGSREWYDALDILAIGITNSILHYSPEIVVIGGGMSKNQKI